MVARMLVLGVLLSAAPLSGQSTSPDQGTLLAFGDVNLGREVGQRLIRGDTAYPFRLVEEMLSARDLVFVNLESQLTDQGGETRHPNDGYRFCGPLTGAASLAAAGIRIVSGSNNHAFDYGSRALRETVRSLEASGVSLAGLASDDQQAEPSVVEEILGKRVGFLAYTEFVNMPGAWTNRISVYSEKKARREIRALQKRADLIVVSYHGGTEYTERPPAGTLRNLRSLAAAGADIVLGHHPHVPQGVEVRGTSVIFYSLGNFVFYQPQRYWTQIGLAACVHVNAAKDAVPIDVIHLVPFRAGLQPSPELSAAELDSLEMRFNSSSPTPLRREGSTFILAPYEHTHF